MILQAPGKIDISYIQKMQGDAYDINGAVFTPFLLDLELASDLTPAQDTLKNWDYQAQADSTSAAVFNAFWRHFVQNTFNDDMPEERYYPEGGSRWSEVMRHMAKNPDDPFWDDKTTTDVTETMYDIMKKSFAEGVAELKDIFGDDISKWNWGDMHAATFRNSTLGESGVFLIEDLLNRGPFPVGGGKSIINATGWDVQDGYETDWLPSMRMIVDLSNLDNSVTVHTTGESGHAYHKHYDDMAPMWAKIEYYPMWWDVNSIVADSEGHLVLKP
jgi:penicillin amidase